MAPLYLSSKRPPELKARTQAFIISLAQPSRKLDGVPWLFTGDAAFAERPLVEAVLGAGCTCST